MKVLTLAEVSFRLTKIFRFKVLLCKMLYYIDEINHYEKIVSKHTMV